MSNAATTAAMMMAIVLIMDFPGEFARRAKLGPLVLDLDDIIRLRGGREGRLIGGKPPLQKLTARVPRVRHVNRERWNAINAFHQLKYRNAFNDDRKVRGNPAFDDAVDLIVEMNEIILCGDQEQIGLDQRHVEVPREIPSKCGFPDSVATVNCNNHTGRSSHGRCQGADDPRVTGEDSGHGAPKLKQKPELPERRASAPRFLALSSPALT